jgi:hypothetical protein
MEEKKEGKKALTRHTIPNLVHPYLRSRISTTPGCRRSLSRDSKGPFDYEKIM